MRALAQPLRLGLQGRVRGVEAHVEEERLLRLGLTVLPHNRQGFFSQGCARWSKMFAKLILRTQGGNSISLKKSKKKGPNKRAMAL